MRAVDTNLIVRLIVRDDANQAAAADTFIAKGAWVSHLVLAEALWVLESVYGLEAPQLAVVVDMLLEHEDLTVQDADVVEAALRDFRRKPSPGFSDCLLVAVARKASHVPVGTFDRRMAKLEDTELL